MLSDAELAKLHSEETDSIKKFINELEELDRRYAGVSSYSAADRFITLLKDNMGILEAEIRGWKTNA